MRNFLSSNFVRPSQNLYQAFCRLHLPQQLHIGSSLVLLVPAFAIHYFGVSFYTIASFVTVSTIGIASSTFSRYIFENSTSEELKRVMSGPENLEYIGNSIKGIQWLNENSHGAIIVYNTICNRTDADVFRQNRDENLESFYKLARKILAAGCEWHDIYLKYEEKKVEEFFKSIPVKHRSSYHPHCLDVEIPVLQALVIKFKDRGSVLFGWGYLGSANDRVFLSSETSNIKYFEDYVRSLRAKSKPVDFSAYPTSAPNAPTLSSRITSKDPPGP